MSDRASSSDEDRESDREDGVQMDVAEEAPNAHAATSTQVPAVALPVVPLAPAPVVPPAPAPTYQFDVKAANHLMAETDWRVKMTAAQASEYERNKVMVSQPFECFGSTFCIELIPNHVNVKRGLSLRVKSLGPVHRVRIRSALAEIYIKKNDTEPSERSKTSRWTPSAHTNTGWDARVDMRDGTAVCWTPFIKYCDLVSKERTHFVSHDGYMNFHVEIYFNKDSMISDSSSLGMDLMKLRENDRTCDITFSVKDGRQLRAHMAVLCARSAYFRTLTYGELFTNNPPPNGSYDAGEFHPDAFKIFLDLVYTDDQRLLDGISADIVLEVLRIADMYCVDTVRTMCDANLAYGATLDVNTCGTLLSTAHRMNWVALKKSAMEFLKRNKAKVLETMTLSKCIAEHPDLALEILRTM